MAVAADAEAIVRARLDGAGIPYSDEELNVFVDHYEVARRQAASLYIPETRYEEPNLVFSLVPYVQPGN